MSKFLTTISYLRLVESTDGEPVDSEHQQDSCHGHWRAWQNLAQFLGWGIVIAIARSMKLTPGELCSNRWPDSWVRLPKAVSETPITLLRDERRKDCHTFTVLPACFQNNGGFRSLARSRTLAVLVSQPRPMSLRLFLLFCILVKGPTIRLWKKSNNRVFLG